MLFCAEKCVPLYAHKLLKMETRLNRIKVALVERTFCKDWLVSV